MPPGHFDLVDSLRNAEPRDPHLVDLARVRNRDAELVEMLEALDRGGGFWPKEDVQRLDACDSSAVRSGIEVAGCLVSDYGDHCGPRHLGRGIDLRPQHIQPTETHLLLHLAPPILLLVGLSLRRSFPVGRAACRRCPAPLCPPLFYTLYA